MASNDVISFKSTRFIFQRGESILFGLLVQPKEGITTKKNKKKREQKEDKKQGLSVSLGGDQQGLTGDRE